MEQLRNIGRTCRQHYEKLVLSAALIIFAGAVYLLRQDSIKQRDEIRKIALGFDEIKVKGVQPASLAAHDAALKLAGTPPAVNFSHPHFLFNPLVWESRGGSDPRKIKGSADIGPLAMRIVKITPLHLSIAFGSPSLSGTEPDVKVNGYWTFSTNEMAAPRSPQRVIKAFVSETETNRQALFFLRGIEGDPKEPAALKAELKDPAGEAFTFAPNKPYLRVLGYEAELRYKPNPTQLFTGLRAGAPVNIDGTIYKIVDITEKAVVLSDDSNGKQFTIDAFAQ